jgi:hypothetical protein
MPCQGGRPRQAQQAKGPPLRSGSGQQSRAEDQDQQAQVEGRPQHRPKDLDRWDDAGGEDGLNQRQPGEPDDGHDKDGDIEPTRSRPNLLRKEL